jgi:hypothetical protein
MKQGIIPRHFFKIITPLLPCWFLFVITYYFIGEIDVNRYQYEHYSSIPENSGVKIWLPNFFPENARKIDVYSNVDINTFGVKFELDDKHNKIFSSELVYSASLAGELLMKKEDKLVEHVWCKAGMDSNNAEALYLLGKYKKKNVYYLIDATRFRSIEKKRKEKLIEAEKKFCLK